jgi:hypothetical protein
VNARVVNIEGRGKDDDPENAAMLLKPAVVLLAVFLLPIARLALAQSPPEAATGLPASEVIVRAYPSDGERLAALKILLDVLEIKVRPKTPADNARSMDYRRAIAALDPPRGGDPRVFEAAHRHMLDDRFKLDVLARFAPAYAPAEARKVGVKREAQGASNNVAFFLTGVVLACLASFASPFVVMAIGHRLVPAGDIRMAMLPIQLPAELRVARVFGQSFELNYDCGTVTSITDIYDPSRLGGGRSTGMTMTQSADGSYHEIRTDWSDPATRPVKPNRRAIALKTRDGRQIERRFEMADYGWREGHTIGLVSFGYDILLALNHSAQRVSQTQEIDWISRAKEGALRLLMIVIAVLGLVLVGMFCLRFFDPPNPMLAGAVVGWMLLMIVVSLFYIRLFGALTKRARVRQFETNCRPGLERFLEEQQGARRAPSGMQQSVYDRARRFSACLPSMRMSY